MSDGVSEMYYQYGMYVISCYQNKIDPMSINDDWYEHFLTISKDD